MHACTLSLFFVCNRDECDHHGRMAVLRDSVGDVSSEVAEVLYVDDTLIVDEHGKLAQIYIYGYHCNSR